MALRLLARKRSSFQQLCSFELGALSMSADACSHFFIYGTLQPAQSRWYLLEQANACVLGPASTAGWLLDLGEYPGLVSAEWFEMSLHPRPNFPDTVWGQLVHVPDPEAACLALDAEEACLQADLGFDSTGQPLRSRFEFGIGLYVRRLQRIILANGTTMWAWTYLYNQAVKSPKWIATGNWLLAQGEGT
jgi:gamma-glutamylcyclotransferase (GGCT)/AIG2-like uncharacterized protein YtfP